MVLQEGRYTLRGPDLRAIGDAHADQAGTANMSGPKPKPPTKSPQTPRVRRPCVVLAPATQVLDRVLLATLDKRGWTPRLEHHPEMAMAEVCLLRREVVQRSAHLGDPEDVPPLIVTNPSDPHTTALIEALAQHLADIPVYETNDDGRLVMVRGEPTTQATDPADPPMVVHPARQTEVNDDELSALLGEPSATPHTGVDP